MNRNRFQYASLEHNTIMIPPEILSSIFSIAIMDITDADKCTADHETACITSALGRPIICTVRSKTRSRGSTPQSLFKFLLIVCHVCHEWRTQVLNNPSLWSTIQYDRNICDAALSFWVMRASGQALNITLHLIPEHDHIQWGYRHSSHTNLVRRDTRLLQALNILIARSHRWRSLTVTARCTFDLMNVIQRLESVPFVPTLERFVIRGEELECTSMISSEDERWFKQPKVFFQGSHPVLCDFRLYCVPTSWCDASTSSLLRVLCIESGHSNNSQGDDSLDALLRCADNLHTLSITSDRSYVFSNGGVHLPFLTRLDVEFTDSEFAFNFFSGIRTTNLTTLSLSLADDDFSIVLEHLSRRPPTENILGRVENLIIKNLNSSVASMDVFISRLTSVRRITFLTTFIGYKTFFKRLVLNATAPQPIDEPQQDYFATPKDRAVCPMLSTFISCGLTGTELVDLVQVRQNIGHPLNQLHMTMDDYIHPHDLSWLSKNVQTFSSRFYYSPLRSLHQEYGF